MRIATIAGMTLLSAATLAAQAGGQQPGGKPGGQTGEAGTAAIRQVADEYVKATLAGDAKAVAALYTDEAVEMPPNQPMIKGRAAIQQYYEKIFSSGMKMNTFTLVHLESRATADSAYDVGTYQQNMTASGAAGPSDQSGKYVVILKRSAGAWKVAYAIYNSDQPPPTGR